MRKIFMRILICSVISGVVWSASLLQDRHQLREGLIRFHVVANSDAAQDQEIKLQVRDAVLESLRRDMESVTDVEKAKAYLQENLPKIQTIANHTLEAAGFDENAVVTLCKEAFDIRYYDTFTLPAGVYESLRIVIGDGAGKNWWCVAFPALCIPATAEGFTDVAAGAGFSDALSNTLADQNSYNVRFFFLDALGRVENMLFAE